MTVHWSLAALRYSDTTLDLSWSIQLLFLSQGLAGSMKDEEWHEPFFKTPVCELVIFFVQVGVQASNKTRATGKIIVALFNKLSQRCTITKF